jgi:hypothetical protein
MGRHNQNLQPWAVGLTARPRGRMGLELIDVDMTSASQPTRRRVLLGGFSNRYSGRYTRRPVAAVYASCISADPPTGDRSQVDPQRGSRSCNRSADLGASDVLSCRVVCAVVAAMSGRSQGSGFQFSHADADMRQRSVTNRGDGASWAPKWFQQPYGDRGHGRTLWPWVPFDGRHGCPFRS